MVTRMLVHDWVLGLSLAMSNAFLTSAGVTMQRKAALLSSATDAEHCQCHPLWILGVVVYVLGTPGDVISYTLIPELVCSAVACFRLCVVAVFAHVFLNEIVHRREAMGILMCSFGTFAVLAFGPKSAINDELPSTTFHNEKVTLYLTVVVPVLILLVLLEHAAWCGCSPGQSVQRACLPCATALAFGTEKIFNTELHYIHKPQHVLEDPLWLVVVGCVALLGILDFYLNLRGVARLPIQFFVPIVFALNTTIQYFQALVIFDEFAELPWHQVVLSGFGAVLSFVGAMLIRPREESTNSDSLWNDSATSGISLRPMHTEPDGPDEMF